MLLLLSVKAERGHFRFNGPADSCGTCIAGASHHFWGLKIDPAARSQQGGDEGPAWPRESLGVKYYAMTRGEEGGLAGILL